MASFTPKYERNEPHKIYTGVLYIMCVRSILNVIISSLITLHRVLSEVQHPSDERLGNNIRQRSMLSCSTLPISGDIGSVTDLEEVNLMANLLET